MKPLPLFMLLLAFSFSTFTEAKISRKRLTNVVIIDGKFINPGTFHFEKGIRHYKKGNKNSAIDRFMLAAEFDNKKAIKFVGLIYYNGDGVKKDIIKGLAWLKLSAYYGDNESIRFLTELTPTLKSDDIKSIDNIYKELQITYGKSAVLENAHRYYRRFRFQTLDKPNSIQQLGSTLIVLNEMQVMRIADEIKEFYVEIKNNYGEVIQGEIIPIEN